MQADLALRANASEQDLKHSLQQIGRSSVRATHTVNQLLSLARAESGAIANQICDLAELVLEVVQDSVPKALDRKIDLGYEGIEPDNPDGKLMGNPTLLKELTRNLVDNAIHYSPTNGSHIGVVTVRLLLDKFSHTIVLQVEDNGPGIPESERELVLQPFYRALGTNADGSGLGLAIVQEIAQKHSAVLTIEAASNNFFHPGSIFSVKFHTLTPDEVLKEPVQKS
jgi:two-component system sensor histidine kinase TctE